MSARPKLENIVNRIAMLVIVAGVGFTALVVVLNKVGGWFAS